MLLGNRCPQLSLELLGIDFSHALVLAGNHGIDPIGLVTDAFVDPLEFGLELFHCKADGSEHPEAPRFTDLDDDIPAVRKCEYGYVDAKPVAEIGTHGGSIALGAASRCFAG